MISESEHRRLIDEHHDARHAAFRWGACAESLIHCRNELRDAASDRVYIRHDGPQLQMLLDAAKALGPFIAKAVGFQKNAEEAMARIDAELVADRPRIPPEESNIATQDFLNQASDEKWQRIADNRCCGDTPDEEGICFGVGKCPALADAERLLEYMASFRR